MIALGQMLGAALFGLVATLLLMPGAIKLLIRLRMGKSIRAEGPAHHASKAGTPTMGGVVMVAAAMAGTLAFAPDLPVSLVLVAFLVAFAILGSLDDLRALRLHRAMGLRAREKFAGQLLLGAVLAGWALSVEPDALRLVVPFTGSVWEVGPWAFVALATLATVASANAVNLTDGLDGLAAGSVAAASAAYALGAFWLDKPSVGVFAAALSGACLAFIWFNGYPAQVIMGDTGSLALGAALSAMAIFSGTILVLPLVGGLFVIETASVMAQVSYFRMTGGRRLFRMSPIHHHLELAGWSEPQVVVRMWLAAAVFGLLGLWGMLGGFGG